MHARKQYLADIHTEYEGADEGGRKRLLDEAQKRTGCNRKDLIRVLNRPAKLKPAAGRVRRSGDHGAGGDVGHLRATVRATPGGDPPLGIGPAPAARGVAV